MTAYDNFYVVITPAIIPVEVDIKPGSDPNGVNCNNEQGIISVAILSTPDFDATTVDHTTVRFGLSGTEAGVTHINKKTGEPKRHEEDANGDGATDIVFHFLYGDTGLTCSSAEGVLLGTTLGGQPIGGGDAVSTRAANPNLIMFPLKASLISFNRSGSTTLWNASNSLFLLLPDGIPWQLMGPSLLFSSTPGNSPRPESTFPHIPTPF